MNGTTKTALSVTSGVIVTVLAAGIVMFVRTSLANSKEARETHTRHELSTESHPLITQKVDSIVADVSKIAGNVETMMIRQEVQTVMIENMAEDISELKEGQ